MYIYICIHTHIYCYVATEIQRVFGTQQLCAGPSPIIARHGHWEMIIRWRSNPRGNLVKV